MAQERQRKHSYPHPVWSVAPNGKMAIVMDPARLDATEKGTQWCHDRVV